VGAAALLDELTELIARSRAMPMSSSVLVNRTEAFAILDDLHEALPEQLADADAVLSDADAALAEAREQAAQLVARARSQAEQLVARESVVEQARLHAEQLLAHAEHVAASLRREADDYCDRRLAEFEIDLGRVLAQVQGGRARLADRLEDHDAVARTGGAVGTGDIAGTGGAAGTEGSRGPGRTAV